MAKIVFKEFTSNQNVLFPVSLSEKIAPNYPVRVVNSVIDALDISCLLWTYKGQGKSKSDLGYVSVLKRYQAQNCEGYPLKSQCHKSKTNRIIEVNYSLNRYKQKAR